MFCIPLLNATFIRAEFVQFGECVQMGQTQLGDSELAVQGYEAQVLEGASFFCRFGPGSQHPVIEAHARVTSLRRGHEETAQVVEFRHKDKFV
jgi:hypothetical protein